MYILSKMEKVNFLKTKERRYSLTYIVIYSSSSENVYKVAICIEYSGILKVVPRGIG